jgi:hypothetical protein|nr:endodeoxyribonuclease [Neorhizobium tomejilense]
MTYRTPASELRQVGLREGFRSGLEDKVGDQLRALGIEPRYEETIIPYVKPERKAKYTPDFQLPNGIFIETKGRFVTEDRQKHLLIKAQHPELDIRFVFSNPKARISKTSKTTYADWCLKHGFLFAAKTIPQEWIDEHVHRP